MMGSERGRGSLLPNPLRSFKCEACDLWSSNYTVWTQHLTSAGHQKNVTSSANNPHCHERWREDSIRNTCLIVSGVKNVSVDVLVNYLSRFGCLIDIIRQQDKSPPGPFDFYFLRYETEEAVMKVLAAQSRQPHQIQGQQIYFRRKYDRITSNNSPSSQRYQSDTEGHQTRRTHTTSGGLGTLASMYRDESESALGALQSTYGEESDVEEMKCEEDPEEHDLFSLKMTEHLAVNLANLKLAEQLDEFQDKVTLSQPFLEGRIKIMTELQALLKLSYPKCTIYPCGPDYIGIGNSDDAVNVFVDLFDNQLAQKRPPWESSSEHHIPEIFKILKYHEDKYEFCSNVSKKTATSAASSIPIISFTHLGSRVKCNIRTEGYPIVQEGLLVRFLCSLDPRVKPLLILIRYWSSFNKLLDSPNSETRNRVPILLMLFHLTNRKIIPSLSHLQGVAHKEILFNKMDLGFCADPIDNKMGILLKDKGICCLSALSLLKDFFARFGVANFKENAVCLWPAKFVEKKNLAPGNEEKLDEDFGKKLRFAADGSIIMKGIDVERSVMCIQDFFDVTFNLGEEIGAEELKAFQIKAWKTSEKLEDIINSGNPYLMDMFIESTENLLKHSTDTGISSAIIEEGYEGQHQQEQYHQNQNIKSGTLNYHKSESHQGQRAMPGPSSHESTSTVEDSYSASSNAKYDKVPKVRPQDSAFHDDDMNIEWEEFARSLEQPAKPFSFLNSLRKSGGSPRKPVAPVAPSQKPSPSSAYGPAGPSPYLLNNPYYRAQNPQQQQQQHYAAQNQNPQQQHYAAQNQNPQQQHYAAQNQNPQQQQSYMHPNQMMGSSSIGGMVARPPLRYDPLGTSGGVMMRGPSHCPQAQTSHHNQYSMEVESEEGDDSEEDSSDSDSEEEGEQDLISTKTMLMPKVTLNKFMQNFFIRAVQTEDFSYGIRGKLQALFLQFMVDFNNRFWSKCLGFEIELDPPYQSVIVADYAKFNDARTHTRGQRMNSVPIYEESYCLKFYCQSRPVMNKVLNARRNDFLNGKFVRRQVGPLLTFLMDDSIGSCGGGGMMGSIAPADRMRIRCQFTVTLDYQDLKQDCHPSFQIAFEDCGAMSMSSANMPKLRFLGRCFNRMAAKFVDYSFKRWLGSCSDFDLVAAQRVAAKEKNDQNREKNALLRAQGKGKISKKKKKKEMKRQREMQMQEGGSGGKVPIMGRGGPGGISARGATGRGGVACPRRNFQVPASWNRSMDFDPRYQSGPFTRN